MSTSRETHKAVILARGLGTRMRQADRQVTLDREQEAAADAGAKGLMPVGRPFLDYVISGLADAGLTDVCLVIAPGPSPLRERYSAEVSRVRVGFAIQNEARGTADAVAAAAEFAGQDTFLVLNSDNYYPVRSIRELRRLGCAGLVGFDAAALSALGNVPDERIRRFALIEVDDADQLVAIHEKPDLELYRRIAATSLISMNLWSFSPLILEACRRVQPSVRGELELQDAVRICRDELGERFTVLRSVEGVLDLSSRADVAAVTRRLSGVVVSL
ncbi:MAG: sugar phosphate nucleotidyltransferase [Gemmatimonadota bacterium]